MEHTRRRALLAAVTGLAAGNVVAVGAGEAQAQAGQTLPQTAAAAPPTGTTGVLYFHQQLGLGSSAPQQVTVTEDGKTVVAAPAAMPYLERGLSYSPDGTKIAYATPAGVVVCDTSFGNATTAIPYYTNYIVNDPKWLPGSAGLAYLRTDNTTHLTTIWTAHPDGSAAAAVPLPAAFATATIDAFDVMPNGGFVFKATVGGVAEADYYHPGDASATQLVSGNVDQVAADPDGVHATVAVTDPAHPANGGAIKNIDVSTKAVTSLAGGAEQYQPLAWSPDGTKLAFTHLDTLATVLKAAANTDHLVLLDKAAGTTTDVVAPSASTPDYLSYAMGWQVLPTVPPSGPRAQVDRVGGGDRIATAVDTSQLGYNNTGAGGRQAASAVLSRSDTFADALAGSALAAHKNGPLLLTPTGALDPTVQAELVRVLPAHAPVYLLGGTAALSDNVFNQVAALGFTPVRVSGNDRNETAVAIAKQITPTPHTFLVGTGRNFPDALAAGASAGAQPDAVVLLSDDGKLPTATADYLAANHHAGDVLLGVGVQGSDALKTSALSGQITQEFRGTDRFDTATLLATYYYSGPFPPKNVGIATGYNWPDALGGGALLGAHPGPLLLDGVNGLPQGEVDYLKANGAAVQEIVAFGGTKVVPQADLDAAANDTKGTGNWDYYANRKAPAMP